MRGEPADTRGRAARTRRRPSTSRAARRLRRQTDAGKFRPVSPDRRRGRGGGARDDSPRSFSPAYVSESASAVSATASPFFSTCCSNSSWMHRFGNGARVLVPFDDDLVPLLVAREVEVADRSTRIGNHALEEVLEVPDDALGRRPVVEIGRVFERAGHAVADLGQRQREVEHRGVGYERELRCHEVVELQVAPARCSGTRTCAGRATRAPAIVPVAAPSRDARTEDPGVRMRRVRPRAPAAISSMNDGLPERSVRSTNVFAKNPMRRSVSSRGRFAIAVPTAMSSWPP